MAAERSTVTLMRQIDEALRTGRTPVLTGNTGDLFPSPTGPIYGLPHLVALAAVDEGATLVLFSLAHGSRDLNPTSGAYVSTLRHVTTEDGAAPALADLFDQLEISATPTWLLVDYSDLLIPPAPPGESSSRDQERVIELLSEQALRQASGRTPHRLVVLARAGSGIDARLAALPSFAPITVGLPDVGDRMQALERLTSAQAVGGSLRLEPGLRIDEAARLTGGLSTFDLVHARRRSEALGEPLTRSAVQSAKAEAIRQRAGETLQILSPGNGLADVAGLPAIQLLVREYRATGWFPRRILLPGPPGVGKTLVVRSLGHELGMPVVRLHSFRSPWVGESERGLARALDTVNALAPCILLLDEVDQDGGQRNEGPSGDSGLSARLLATLWGWLSDRQGRDEVFVMATSNRPDLVDTALFDRFEFIPVLHPTPAEAAHVMRIAVERGGSDLDVRDAEAEVRRYDRLLTGRVLVDVTSRAITLSRIDGTGLHAVHIRRAFDELLNPVPAAQHERLGLLALSTTTFASRLPWVAARALGEEEHIPYYVKPYIGSDGSLDTDGLAADLGR